MVCCPSASHPSGFREGLSTKPHASLFPCVRVAAQGPKLTASQPTYPSLADFDNSFLR
jgi:hypothetical protein